MTDDREDFIYAVLGKPPQGFSDTIMKAQKICDVIDAAGIEVDGTLFDALLVAAMAAYQDKQDVEPGKRANPVGYIGRARQIANWLTTKSEDWKADDFEHDSLAALENKARHIATVIGKLMYESEGMILCLFHLGIDGTPGYFTYLSSVNRRDQIKLLDEHLKRLKLIQDEHS